MDRSLRWPVIHCLVAAWCLFWMLPGHAVTRTLILEPRSAQINFRAYGLGVVPIDGAFARFTGTLIIDSADPAVCQVDLQAEAASLQMPDPSMTQEVLGPDLLDVSRYPAFAFKGSCGDGRVRGILLLHGVSRPLALDVTRAENEWVATGRMRRADWGMSARPLLAGPEIRIRFTAALPSGLPAAR